MINILECFVVLFYKKHKLLRENSNKKSLAVEFNGFLSIFLGKTIGSH